MPSRAMGNGSSRPTVAPWPRLHHAGHETLVTLAPLATPSRPGARTFRATTTTSAATACGSSIVREGIVRFSCVPDPGMHDTDGVWDVRDDAEAKNDHSHSSLIMT